MGSGLRPLAPPGRILAALLHEAPDVRDPALFRELRVSAIEDGHVLVEARLANDACWPFSDLHLASGRREPKGFLAAILSGESARSRIRPGHPVVDWGRRVLASPEGWHAGEARFAFGRPVRPRPLDGTARAPAVPVIGPFGRAATAAMERKGAPYRRGEGRSGPLIEAWAGTRSFDCRICHSPSSSAFDAPEMGEWFAAHRRWLAGVRFVSASLHDAGGGSSATMRLRAARIETGAAEPAPDVA